MQSVSSLTKSTESTHKTPRDTYPPPKKAPCCHVPDSRSPLGETWHPPPWRRPSKNRLYCTVFISSWCHASSALTSFSQSERETAGVTRALVKAACSSLILTTPLPRRSESSQARVNRSLMDLSCGLVTVRANLSPVATWSVSCSRTVSQSASRSSSPASSSSSSTRPPSAFAWRRLYSALFLTYSAWCLRTCWLVSSLCAH